MSLVLVLGGTRSGKSLVAERLAAAAAPDGRVAYLATGASDDPALAERIARHRARRPASWETIEVGDEPADALEAAGDRVVLLDGLGAWITGVLHRHGAFEPGAEEALAEAGVVVGRAVERLAQAAAERASACVVVVEEAGLGALPASAATRRYLDLAGEASQRLAAVAERVLLVVAGRAVELPADEAGSGVPPGAPASDPTARAAPAHHAPEPPAQPTSALASSPPAPRPVHGDRLVPPGHEDFAVNVVPGGPPPWLAAALRGALDAVDRYPDERLVVEAVAARHDRPADHVLLLNGAAEGFWLLAAALRPRLAVVVSPAFAEPVAALRAHAHPPVLVSRTSVDGFALHPDAVPEQADLVVVGNPCNPTGRLHPAATLAALARPGRTLVVDESFMDLVPHEVESLVARADLPGLVVLRSLTKSLGIPGVRAGHLLGPPELVARLGGLRQAWPLNTLALAALSTWAARPEPTAELAARVADDRARQAARLSALPSVRVFPGAANFLLLRVPDGPTVRRRLAEHAIAVRPTEDLGLDADHLRVAVRGGAADERLAAALAAAVGSPATPAAAPAPVGAR